LARALTRDAILDAAEALFEARGIHNTAVEVVAADAGVTKRTFYNHFLSKDELVALSLSRRSAKALEQFRIALARAPGGPAEKLCAVLTSNDPDCRAARACCGSLSSVGIELASVAGHPAHEVIAGYRRAMQSSLTEWLTRNAIDGVADKASILDQVLFSLMANDAVPGQDSSPAVILRVMHAILDTGRD
jgi:AcrR family transcriptional regulator